ncbi:hypothetical protein AYO43_06325 [Nitrospira sp. SCGC AG-212-E16]|nr:hypothetical protein AYO43_06325 [Nitrospira sp. SCGC AG-212-E16]
MMYTIDDYLGALAGCRITIRHILYKGGKLMRDRRAFLQETQPAFYIFGHRHRSNVEWFDKTLVFNQIQILAHAGSHAILRSCSELQKNKSG